MPNFISNFPVIISKFHKKNSIISQNFFFFVKSIYTYIYVYIYFRKIDFWYYNFKISNYFCSQVSKAEASEAGLIGGLGHRNQDLTKLQLKRHRRLARTKEHVLETPLDLELDLAAQKTKLDLLQSDISRLRDIQCKLQEAQLAGQLDDEERASWLQDHEYLEGLLSKVILKS